MVVSLLLLFQSIDYFIWHAQVLDLSPAMINVQQLFIIQMPTYVVAFDIDLWQLVKLVTIGRSLHNFTQNQVHPGVARNQVAVERFSVFEFDQHRVSNGSSEKAQG
jgi:hypothetical protein